MNKSDFIATAKTYQSMSFHVLPVNPVDKTPTEPWAVLRDRTPDDKEMSAWFSGNTELNIGITTGPESNLTVIDIDTSNWESYIKALKLPTTLTAITNRGAHLYYRHDPAITNKAKLLPHLDARSLGGYVQAPGSSYPSGKVCKWFNEGTPIADFPAGLSNYFQSYQEAMNMAGISASKFNFATDDELKAMDEGDGRNGYAIAHLGAFRHMPTTEGKFPNIDDVRVELDRIDGLFAKPLKTSEKTGMMHSMARYMEKDLTEAVKTLWMNKLERTKEGAIKDTFKTVSVLVENDPAIKGIIARNDLSDRIFRNEGAPWRKESGNWDDRDLSQLRRFMSNKYHVSGKEPLFDCVSNLADFNAFHPIRDIINAAEWDGVPRMDTVFTHFCQVADIPEHHIMSKRWLLGCIARIYNPGVKFDYAVILTGPQGIGKSQFFHKLAIREEWFLEINPSGNLGKDVVERLRGKWIVEIGEMAVLKKAEEEVVKSFITAQADSYRPSYGRYSTDFNRQNVFGGTSNRNDFLHDDTGSRRFLCMHTDSMDTMWHELTPDTVLQIWAEALSRYKAGEQCNLTPTEEQLMKDRAAQFTESNPLVSALAEFLDQPVPKGWSSMSTQQRIAWGRSHAEYTDSETEIRQKVSVPEIIIEYFEDKKRMSDKLLAKNIRSAMRQIDCWEDRQVKIGGENSRGWHRI